MAGRRRKKSWLTEDAEEREWFPLARAVGCTVAELQERMTDAEFRRHCEDRADHPDAADRGAYSLYVISLLLNSFIGSWTKDGKPPFSLRDIAPWMRKDDQSEQAKELTLQMAEVLFRHVGDPNVKIRSR